MKKLITLIGVFACMLFLLPGDGWCPPPSAPTPAKQSKTVTTNFDGELSSADDTVQKALDTLDDVVGTGDTTETNQDDAWKAVSDATGTETFITVTYQDATNDVDFVVPVIDDDSMATAADTNLSTSEAIKAYVDAQVSTLTADSVQNSHIDWADIDNLGEEGLLTVTDTVDTTSFVGLFESATGDLAAKTDAGLTYNAGTGVLTATGFVGPITGAVTGNADSATLAATVTIADNEATNETNAVVFLPGGDLDGGNLALESDGTFNYNPSSGTVTATAFVGDLTGDVTGNASGTAATVTGAAQAAITSVGTLTTLAVDNITINGNDISSTAGTDLTITPLAGQQIVLDGTIIIDAGEVTGATSITSTAFVGDITGDVTGNVSGTAGLATTVTITDNEDTNETNAVVFLPGGDLDGGDLALESDGTFNYNPNTGVVTSTAFTGTKVTLTPADASPAADGEVLLDSTVTGLDDGALAYYEGGDTVYYVAAFPVLPVTDNHVLSYDSATDRLVWQADADSGGAPTLDNVVSPEAAWAITAQDTEDITITSQTTATDFFSVDATGAFGDISVFVIEQKTGNPTNGTLLELTTADAEANVDNLLMSNGADDYVTHTIIEDGTYTIDVTSDNTPLVAITDNVTVTGTVTASTGFALGDTDYIGIPANEIITFNAAGNITVSGASLDLTSGGITNSGTIADDAAITLISSGGTVTVESVVFTGGAVTAVTDLTASGTISANLFTPDAADGADIGSTTLEFSDVYLADESVIKFGDDQEVTLTHVPDVGLDINLALGILDNQTIIFGTSDDTTIGYDTTDARVELTTTLSAATGDEEGLAILYTTNKATSGNDTGLLINQTDTASPGTSYLVDMQVGGTSKFNVDNTGKITTAGSDDPYWLFAPATSGETSWYINVDHDAEGDDDDSVKFSTTGLNDATPEMELDTSGNLIAEGSLKGTSLILEGGTYDTTLDPGTPTASISYQWPLAAPGVSGYALTATTGGVMSWSEITAAADTTGGAGAVQYNNGGLMLSDADFVFDGDTLVIDQNAANDALAVTTGGTTPSWGHTPLVGIETVLEVDGISYLDGGVTIAEDIDINLDAADEEIAIDQTAVAGTEDVGLIKINDDRTGATATEQSEATIWIDAEGVYGISIIDGSLSVEGDIVPAATDGAALGTDTLDFSDLWLADGGKIDFDSGDLTLTHSAELLTFAGGAVDVDGAFTASTVASDGAVSGTTITGTGKISNTVTTEQLRLNYDATNYLTATVDAEGATTITTVDADAANANLTFSPDGTIILTPATDVVGAFTAASVTSDANVAGTTYGSDSSISDAELLTLDNGATTEILVGGGAGSAPVWTTATGTGAPARAGSPAFTGEVTIGDPGGIKLTDDNYIELDATADGMDDDEYNGVVIGGRNCGETLTQWDLVEIVNDADPWHKADATAASGEYPAFGIAVAACTDTNEAIILVKGVVRNEGWTGLTPGAPIYLGETDGALTETAPSTSNDAVQIVGWALSDSEIYFDFSRPYQLVE